MKKMGLLAVLFAVIFLAGCAGIGLMSSEMENFLIKDDIELKTKKSNSDILDIVVEVGRSMDFKVISLDKKNGSVSFSYKSSTFKGVMLGSGNGAETDVFLKEGTLSIAMGTWGNFGTGGQKAAEELLKNFKEKLLEKLK